MYLSKAHYTDDWFEEFEDWLFICEDRQWLIDGCRNYIGCLNQAYVI